MNKLFVPLALIGAGIAALLFNKDDITPPNQEAVISDSVISPEPEITAEPEEPVIIEPQAQYESRGLKNNNPGNIVDSDTKWQGMLDTATDGDTKFVVFESALFGIRALAKVLFSYFYVHNLNTVEGIITRYAPPSENSTDDYITYIATQLNVDRNEELNFEDQIYNLIYYIIKFENGSVPYTKSTIMQGIQMANVI